MRPQGKACYSRLRDHTRQAEERLQIEDDLHATLHVRDICIYRSLQRAALRHVQERDIHMALACGTCKRETYVWL